MDKMQPLRIHITGASGSGVTTLVRSLSIRTAHPHFDADDFYWLPTNPPFEQKRAPAERLRLVHELFAGRPDWILSGSLDSWGNELVPLFDLVVFLEAPTEVRLARLRAREAIHFGATAVGPAALVIGNSKSSSTGPRITRTGRARAAAAPGTRLGSPSCHAACCGSTARRRSMRWWIGS